MKDLEDEGPPRTVYRFNLIGEKIVEESVEKTGEGFTEVFKENFENEDWTVEEIDDNFIKIFEENFENGDWIVSPDGEGFTEVFKENFENGDW